MCELINFKKMLLIFPAFPLPIYICNDLNECHMEQVYNMIVFKQCSIYFMMFFKCPYSVYNSLRISRAILLYYNTDNNSTINNKVGIICQISE